MARIKQSSAALGHGREVAAVRYVRERVARERNVGSVEFSVMSIGATVRGHEDIPQRDSRLRYRQRIIPVGKLRSARKLGNRRGDFIISSEEYGGVAESPKMSDDEVSDNINCTIFSYARVGARSG